MKQLGLFLFLMSFSLYSIDSMADGPGTKKSYKKAPRHKKIRVHKEGIKQELSHKFQSEYDSGRNVATDQENLDSELSKRVQGKYDQERDVARGDEGELEEENGVSPVDNQKVKRWKYSPKEDNLD